MDKVKKVINFEKDYGNTSLQTDWLTRKQASLYIQVGISTLDTCIHIKKYKIGKSVRYNKKDLDDYLMANCVEPKKGGKKDGE